MIRLARNTLLAIAGVMSAIWLFAMIFAGGPQTLGEGLLTFWALVTLGAAVLSVLAGRRPRAESLGAFGERTP